MERVIFRILVEDLDLDDLKRIKELLEEVFDDYDDKSIEVSTLPAPSRP